MRVILTAILAIAVINLSFANVRLEKALTSAINAYHLSSALVAVKVVNASSDA